MRLTKIFSVLLTATALNLSLRTTVAQEIKQTVKGIVFDLETHEPLIGATVVVLNSDPIIGVITDVDGSFTLRNTVLGRHSFQFSYIGYEPTIVSEVLVTSGREVVLEVGLQQMAVEVDEVVVRAYTRKDKPLNSMASLSARSFTVEETRRYAGGFDDPARLVSAFAGVAVGNVQNNAIVVRGNSPKGVSWRLDGVEIPTPHHFPNVNVTGGGLVTVLSSQMLANSDFFTSAFPAEYGNALAGVFDMKLRSGNADRQEHTFQAGVLGLDISSEGPFPKGSGSSYLFNYRYSTFGLLGDLRLVDMNGTFFRYQDLSFKFNLPTQRAGTFSLWGIGGVDYLNDPHISDRAEWEQDWDRIDGKIDYTMGAMGISHGLIRGSKTFVSSTIAVSGVNNRMETERLDDDLILQPDFFSKESISNITMGTSVNHRLRQRHNVKAGGKYRVLLYNLNINSTFHQQPESYQNLTAQNGVSGIVEMYVQSRHHISERVSLNSGVNASYFALNGNHSVDPRIGLSWNVHPNHSISAAYGRHSQLEELKIYLLKHIEDGQEVYPNRNLKFTKAHHLVIGYDWRISNHIRLKVEPYYQRLFDVPGTAQGTYSLINFKEDRAFNKALVNNGAGRNYGIDLTLERFLNQNYYYLVTASLFESTYKAQDGIWRNSRYNKNHVANVLFGRELFFTNNQKVLGLNGRLNLVGGERVSPILTAASAAIRDVVFDESRAFANQLPTTIYLDISITYRINKSRHSSVWAIQVKNILAAPVYEGYNFNYKTQNVQMFKNEGLGAIPSISYKVEF